MGVYVYVCMYVCMYVSVCVYEWVHGCVYVDVFGMHICVYAVCVHLWA